MTQGGGVALQFPNLKRLPSLAIWLGALALCGVFALVSLAGFDPIPEMAVCAVVICVIAVIVRSREFPSL
jgi:hypothetical protein